MAWLTHAGCSRGFWVWNVRGTGGDSWKWYINQPFLKLYFDRITIVFHVHVVCFIKSKYTTINNSAANYLQTYVLILFLYMERHPIVPLIKYPQEVALSMSLYGAATKVCQTGVWSLCVCVLQPGLAAAAGCPRTVKLDSGNKKWLPR